MTESTGILIHKAKMAVDRLERLSVDSSYAHLASGLRGAILRAIMRFEGGEEFGILDEQRLGDLVTQGYNILVHAAEQIPEYE